MSRTIAVILAVWISLLSSPVAVPLQDQTSWYSFRSEQIPKYFVVKAFYSQSYPVRNSGDFQKKMREWGIRPASSEEEIFFQAIKDANWIITETLELGPYLKDPARFEEVQDAFNRKKVRALRDLHRKTMTALAAAGVNVRAIDGYIETFRDSMSLGSTSPVLDEKGIWAEFEVEDLTPLPH